MSARSVIAFICLLAIALGGCGRDEEGAPVACLEGSEVYLRALDAAPGAVRLDGETPISECLTENQPGGELASVGTAMVEAATRLNAEARKDPGGDANLQIGYLIGAAKAGAERTEGIHTDLIRRLVVAGRFAPGREPLSPAFLATYRRGFDAGYGDG